MADALYSPPTSGVATTNISRQPIDRAQPPTEPLLNGEKAMNIPSSWPTSPKPVKNSIFIVASNFLFDIFLLVCALAFLIFAVAVNRYDQASTAENPRATQRLQSATKYGPTVFPILFASIVGRAAHAILLWRLEKGERVGILDILATSTSLTSTVTSQFQLRIVSVLGLGLVAIWALSPIGGQASLRQMAIGMKNESQATSFNYMVHNGFLIAYKYSDRATILEIANTLFLGALMSTAATKLGPRDNWGNVKIPKIEYYEQRSTSDGEGWFETKKDDVSSYASLIGIPIDGINRTDFIDYNTNVHTSYLYIDCVIAQIVGDYNSGNYSEYIYANVPPGSQSANGTGAQIWYAPDWQCRWNNDPRNLKPVTFTYWPTYGVNSTLRCSVTTSYVESQVLCSVASNCSVSRVRRSKLDHQPSAWTFMDIQYFYWPLLLESFMSSTQGHSGSPTLLDKYLTDPFLVITSENDFTNQPASESDSSTRLGQLMNTFFTCLNGLYAISGGINNETSFYWDQNQSFIASPLEVVSSMSICGNQSYQVYNWTGDGRKARIWSAQGTKSTSSEIIIAHKGWVTALSIASILLILSSLVSPVVCFFLIKGPEVMMNISSLAIRNNSFVPLPGSGTYLDAADRARLLKDLKVRFGDVQSAGDQNGNDVGRLAIGSLENAEIENIARIRKGRWYE